MCTDVLLVKYVTCTTCKSHAWRGEKRVLDLLGMELQVYEPPYG